jgi:hypothetical protein
MLMFLLLLIVIALLFGSNAAVGFLKVIGLLVLLFVVLVFGLAAMV